MPEGYPRTPEESVDVLARAKAAGEKERSEIELPKKSTEAEPAEEKSAAETEEKKLEAEVEKVADKAKIEVVIKEIEKMPVKEIDPEQKFDSAEAKTVRKDIKKGALVSAYGKGLVAAPFIAAGVLIYGAYKVMKAMVWDHWLKKYLGGIADILETGKKK